MAPADFELHFKPFIDLNPQSIPASGFLSRGPDPLVVEIKKWRKEFSKQFLDCHGIPTKIRALQGVASKILNAPKKIDALQSELRKRKVNETDIAKQMNELRNVLGCILKSPVQASLPPHPNPNGGEGSMRRQNSVADISPRLMRYEEGRGLAIPRGLSAEQEKSLRGEFAIAKDSIFEEELETLKYKQRAEEICARFSGNVESLIQEFIKLEDPAAVKALGGIIKPHLVTWLMLSAPANPAVGARLLFLIGALPFTVLFDVLASFTSGPEDQGRLMAVFRVLATEIKAVRQHDGRPSIVYEKMRCFPQGVACNITDTARQWFRRSMEKRVRFFIMLCQKCGPELSGLKAELERLGPHAVKYDFIQKVTTFKQKVQVATQVAHNIQLLCNGEESGESALLDMSSHLNGIRDTYGSYLKTLEWGSPHIKQLGRDQEIGSLTKTLASMQKRTEELIPALEDGSHSPTKVSAELRTLQTQIAALSAQIQQALRLAACKKSVGEVEGFWDSVEEVVYLDNDVFDNAPSLQGIGSWLVLEEAARVGLLVNVPGFQKGTPLQIFNDSPKKAWDWVQNNLELLGLKTVKDMKREYLFNYHLLKAYFTMPDVVATLNTHPYAIDPNGALATIQLYTIEDYIRVGLLRNIPSARIAELRSTPEQLFTEAHANLKRLNLTTYQELSEKFIGDEEALRQYLRRPEIIVELQKYPYTS